MSVIVLEAANLFVGDEAPTRTNHLALLNVRLPELREEYYSHLAGGAPREIEIPTHQVSLECSFQLAGWQARIVAIMAQQAAHRNPMPFTIYGALRDVMTRKLTGLRAVMEGRLGQACADPWARGVLGTLAYSVKAITSYTLQIDNQVVHDWSFFTNELQAFEVPIAPIAA